MTEAGFSIAIDKVRTFWEAHKFWKKNPHGFDVYLVNQLVCQNHEEDFFQILSASQKVRTLTQSSQILYCMRMICTDIPSVKECTYKLQHFRAVCWLLERDFGFRGLCAGVLVYTANFYRELQWFTIKLYCWKFGKYLSELHAFYRIKWFTGFSCNSCWGNIFSLDL